MFLEALLRFLLFLAICWQKLYSHFRSHGYSVSLEVIFSSELERVQGHPRNVSVNYQFGSPLIPSDFFTSNFRDMRNLMSVVFGLFRKMKKKALMNSRIPKFP